MDNLKPIAYNGFFSAQQPLTKLFSVQTIFFKWLSFICLVIPFLVGSSNIAHAQLMFATSASSTTTYSPYNPGTGPGEIGIATDIPGQVNTIPTKAFKALIAGSVSLTCTNQYIPDATITSQQLITLSYSVPTGVNPDQNVVYKLIITGGTHNSSTSGISVDPGPFGTQINTEYLGMEGEDIGGTWNGSGSLYVPTSPKGSVTIKIFALGNPFATGGGNANFSFSINGQAIAQAAGTGPGVLPTS